MTGRGRVVMRAKTDIGECFGTREDRSYGDSIHGQQGGHDQEDRRFDQREEIEGITNIIDESDRRVLELLFRYVAMLCRVLFSTCYLSTLHCRLRLR